MTATKIDGTAIAKKIRERLHSEIEKTQKINPRFKPSLKIIQGRAAAYSRLTQIANLNCSG
jgi:methylenetetrahydrofolate dehydrogenase (NADP+)/methenyltetrahydrofolate cyclohydrolase/formyltetrahydrofolate synthetase